MAAGLHETSLMPRRLTPQERRWRSLTEAQFQSWVMGLARTYGWHVWHFNDSRRQIRPGVFVGDTDAKGFPDLVLVHPRFGIILRELKKQLGKETIDQRIAIIWLGQAGVNAKVWRPSDEAEIERLLSSVRRAGDGYPEPREPTTPDQDVSEKGLRRRA